ncbi:SCO family protein [Bartonella sp. DGB1]|uniref:SCO family protein n=1 Tax=Bartonella sp. DGB1 TaxID=3239807 RepID=UPI0035260FF3
MKKLLLILITFLLLLIGVYYYHSSPVGKDFRLHATDNRIVTLQDLHEKPSIVFFGYTHCPDFCPATFLELSFWLEELGEQTKDLNIWFFTVDPERDSLPILKDYIENFSSQIVGITDEPKKQFKALKNLGANWKKVFYDTKNPNDYTLNHTAGFMLLKKGGALHSWIAFGEDPILSMNKIKDLLSYKDATN